MVIYDHAWHPWSDVYSFAWVNTNWQTVVWGKPRRIGDFVEKLSFSYVPSGGGSWSGFRFRYHGSRSKINRPHMLMAGGCPTFVCGRAVCCGWAQGFLQPRFGRSLSNWSAQVPGQYGRVQPFPAFFAWPLNPYGLFSVHRSGVVWAPRSWLPPIRGRFLTPFEIPLKITYTDLIFIISNMV